MTNYDALPESKKAYARFLIDMHESRILTAKFGMIISMVFASISGAIIFIVSSDDRIEYIKNEYGL